MLFEIKYFLSFRSFSSKLNQIEIKICRTKHIFNVHLYDDINGFFLFGKSNEMSLEQKKNKKKMVWTIKYSFIFKTTFIMFDLSVCISVLENCLSIITIYNFHFCLYELKHFTIRLCSFVTPIQYIYCKCMI